MENKEPLSPHIQIYRWHISSLVSISHRITGIINIIAITIICFMISATKKWIFLKISGAILIPLMLWFVLNLISIYDQQFIEVKSFFTTSLSKFLFSIFIINAYFFSALSISEVFEDYIQNDKIKNVANKLLFASAVVIPLITIILISKL